MLSKIVIGIGALMILWAGWNQLNLAQAKEQKQAVTKLQQQGPFGTMPNNAQFQAVQGQVDSIWEQAEKQAQTRIIIVGVCGLLMVGGGGVAMCAAGRKNSGE